MAVAKTAPAKKNKNKEEGETTVNVGIPDELHKQLRMRQIEEGLTLKEAIADAIEAWVGA